MTNKAEEEKSKTLGNEAYGEKNAIVNYAIKLAEENCVLKELLKSCNKEVGVLRMENAVMLDIIEDVILAHELPGMHCEMNQAIGRARKFMQEKLK